jgi:hypothetical protein
MGVSFCSYGGQDLGLNAVRNLHPAAKLFAVAVNLLNSTGLVSSDI